VVVAGASVASMCMHVVLFEKKEKKKRKKKQKGEHSPWGDRDTVEINRVTGILLSWPVVLLHAFFVWHMPEGKGSKGGEGREGGREGMRE
jgi:hypothetical protein